MADSNTTLYKLVKPEVGASADTWGSKTNADWDSVDKLLGAITTGGSANAYTLTTGQSLSAYASGQSFMIKASFGNTGAATINVDSIGAKSLKKNTSDALASGDLVSGRFYRITYDGTNFIVGGAFSDSYQPADATLTALAALSWSSGAPVLQFTAADTVSLTLTPTLTSLTAASVTLSGGTPLLYLQETDQTTDEKLWRVQVASKVLSLITRTDADGAGATIFSITRGTGTALSAFGIGLTLTPLSNDGGALGTTSLGWSDLCLASGGVLNWNNGAFTLTQSSSTLTASGRVSAASMDGALVKSSEASGTLTSASANTYLDLTGGITMPNAVFSAGQWQLLIAGSASRTITRGASIAMYVNGVDSSSATLSARGMALAYWDGASALYLTGDVA